MIGNHQSIPLKNSNSPCSLNQAVNSSFSLLNMKFLKYLLKKYLTNSFQLIIIKPQLKYLIAMGL
ncbi:MAG: hypothetical protein A2X96_12235 [Syntrophobacterales bacterium GWC2_56_13]|nr:MAG: hypothetical protein A2X96_12235 [Syntrophobacterales bacterium GWC2_56_13]